MAIVKLKAVDIELDLDSLGIDELVIVLGLAASVLSPEHVVQGLEDMTPVELQEVLDRLTTLLADDSEGDSDE